jgi:hypothetical protein
VTNLYFGIQPGSRRTAIVLPLPRFEIPEKYFDRFKSGITVEVPPEGLKDYKLELE